MGGQGSWSASHMEVAAELEHRRLATKAESHLSSRQEGGGQSTALGGGGVWDPNPARRPGNRCWSETGRGDLKTTEMQGAGREKIEKFHSFTHSTENVYAMGFPGGSGSKESVYQGRRHRRCGFDL